MVSKGECSWGIKGKSQDGGKQCEDWKMVLGELRGSGLWSVLREWWETTCNLQNFAVATTNSAVLDYSDNESC